jgi:hypothetical protein
MNMALRIKKRDGAVLWVSSWAAWRLFAHLHMRRSCPACSGEGYQEWMIEGGKDHPTRWFAEQCRGCRGKGWVLP